jgi:hypothetical protein
MSGVRTTHQTKQFRRAYRHVIASAVVLCRNACLFQLDLSCWNQCGGCSLRHEAFDLPLFLLQGALLHHSYRSLAVLVHSASARRDTSSSLSFSYPHQTLADMPFKPKIGVKTSSVAHLDLLHPERLTATSFEAAVAAFGNAIMSAGTCDAILLELLEQPLWAEVVLSGELRLGLVRPHTLG